MLTSDKLETPGSADGDGGRAIRNKLPGTIHLEKRIIQADRVEICLAVLLILVNHIQVADKLVAVMQRPGVFHAELRR